MPLPRPLLSPCLGGRPRRSPFADSLTPRRSPWETAGASCGPALAAIQWGAAAELSGLPDAMAIAALLGWLRVIARWPRGGGFGRGAGRPGGKPIPGQHLHHVQPGRFPGGGGVQRGFRRRVDERGVIRDRYE